MHTQPFRHRRRFARRWIWLRSIFSVRPPRRRYIAFWEGPRGAKFAPTPILIAKNFLLLLSRSLSRRRGIRARRTRTEFWSWRTLFPPIGISYSLRMGYLRREMRHRS